MTQYATYKCNNDFIIIYCIGKSNDISKAKRSHADNDEIPEIGCAGPSSSKIRRMDDPEKFDTNEEIHEFGRPPIICDVYKDPESKCDKCVVVLSLFSGASNVSFELSENCQTLKIKYDWAKEMYNAASIFIAVNPGIPNYHPKYIMFENALEKIRSSIDSIPSGAITVTLPIPVQNDSSTWIKKLIPTENGEGKIVYLEFTGFQKKYAVKMEDRVIS